MISLIVLSYKKWLLSYQKLLSSDKNIKDKAGQKSFLFSWNLCSTRLNVADSVTKVADKVF
jgi:hypothetical protein